MRIKLEIAKVGWVGLRGLIGVCLLEVLAGVGVYGEVAKIELEEVADGMVLPVALVSYGDSDDLLVVDLAGVIHIVESGGGIRAVPFLDLRGKMVELRDGFEERGILGLALHPDFGENGRFYVYYSTKLREGVDSRFDHTSRLSEFRVGDVGEAVSDPASERIILEIDQPQFNHNGGNLVFGPDGYLYISVGDGGAANDVGFGHPPGGNGQDISTLFGSILRIDINVEEGYRIPADNPFVGVEGRDEIYAYGIRNVWGLSFDRGNPGRLFAADVGQDLYEEVNIIEKGGNYGWNLREGFGGFDPNNPHTPPEEVVAKGAMGKSLLDPVIVYKNRRRFGGEDEKAYGVSVTGGYVYRGVAIPGLQGRYVFGDWSRAWGGGNGTLLVADPPEGDIKDSWDVGVLEAVNFPDGLLGAYLLAFGEDRYGELYVMTSERERPAGETGRLYKIVPAEAGGAEVVD